MHISKLYTFTASYIHADTQYVLFTFIAVAKNMKLYLFPTRHFRIGVEEQINVSLYGLNKGKQKESGVISGKKL
jgi:hypothetical protein